MNHDTIYALPKGQNDRKHLEFIFSSFCCRIFHNRIFPFLRPARNKPETKPEISGVQSSARERSVHRNKQKKAVNANNS